jgi:hypothetical protein
MIQRQELSEMAREPDPNVLVTSAMDAAAGAQSALIDGVTGVDIPALDTETIAALHYSLLGQEYVADGIDLSILNDHKEVFCYNQMHGAWLNRFPDTIVECLAALEPPKFDQVAIRWLKIYTNEWRPISVKGENAAELDEVREILALPFLGANP